MFLLENKIIRFFVVNAIIALVVDWIWDYGVSTIEKNPSSSPHALYQEGEMPSTMEDIPMESLTPEQQKQLESALELLQ